MLSCRSVIVLTALFYSQYIMAEFHDPMQPPAYAINKLRLEKITKTEVTKPVLGAEVKKEPWVLNSILYSSQRKHAIINNKLVKKGDLIKGAKLVRLRPDSVRLLARGKAIDLTLEGRSKTIKKSRIKRKL